MWKKRLADVLTYLRLFLVFGVIALTLSGGVARFQEVALFLLVAWVTDFLDGPLARSSGVKQQTWIGAHDLIVDMLMGSALLFYLSASGYMRFEFALCYFAIWLVLFLYRGDVPKSFGALFQAPIYIWFVWIALREALSMGWCLILWVVVSVSFTWKRFFRHLVPEFFNGLRENTLIRL